MVRPCEADLEENIKVNTIIFTYTALGCFHPLVIKSAVLTGSQFQVIYFEI